MGIRKALTSLTLKATCTKAMSGPLSQVTKPKMKNSMPMASIGIHWAWGRADGMALGLRSLGLLSPRTKPVRYDRKPVIFCPVPCPPPPEGVKPRSAGAGAPAGYDGQQGSRLYVN